MTRLNIEVTAPASDEFMEQARVLLGVKPELDALLDKLKTLGVTPTSSAGFIRETVRKPKVIPANPAAPDPANAAGNGGVVLADEPKHVRGHRAAAE